MRHDWVLDVLTDLLSYSQKNGLTALAHRVEEALAVARDEISDTGMRGGRSLGALSGRRH